MILNRPSLQNLIGKKDLIGAEVGVKAGKNAKDMLEKLGYKVVVAESGRKAVEIYERNQNAIDMVILDMIMPDMSGNKTYDRLKEINPAIKTMLSSGYGINGEAQAILNSGCHGFIQKPFNLTNLSQKIRKILDAE